jgi:hypothetical protein
VREMPFTRLSRRLLRAASGQNIVFFKVYGSFLRLKSAISHVLFA